MSKKQRPLSAIIIVLAFAATFSLSSLLFSPKRVVAQTPVLINDISFYEGQMYNSVVRKYPETVYRRGDVFDITLGLKGEPIFAMLTLYGPAGYTTIVDTISCSANSDDLADCNQGTLSENGSIEWLGWDRYRVTLTHPDINDVLIGNYKVSVMIVGNDDSVDEKDSQEDFGKHFSVIFNPFDEDDEVYRPDDDVRRAYVYSPLTGAAARDEYGVWYHAHEWEPFFGNWRTEGYQHTFALRPYSSQIFDQMIAVLDAEALSEAEEAYKELSTWVDGQLVADPSKVQRDVIELETAGTEAQCASQANFLVAHLRSAGIPSMPVYVDANKWDAVNWNFHTWVQAWMNDDWLAVDPFSNINTPMPQLTLGAAGAAYDEENNDLIGIGIWDWTAANNNERVYQAIFDGPDPDMKTFASTVVGSSFLESSRRYWPDGARSLSVAPAISVTVDTDNSTYAVGGSVGVTVTLRNMTNMTATTTLTVTVDGDDLLTKSPADTSSLLLNGSWTVPPNQQILLPATSTLLPEARTDYSYRVLAVADEHSGMTTFEIEPQLTLSIRPPTCTQPNEPDEIPIWVTNQSTEVVDGLAITATLPASYMVQEPLPIEHPALAPGKTFTTTLTVTAGERGIAEMTLLTTSDNGGNFETPVTFSSLCPVYLPIMGQQP